MRKVLLFLFLLFTGNLLSQSYFLQDGSLVYDSLTSGLVQLGGLRIDQSNALNRELLSKIAFGGHITDEAKNNIQNNLDRQNYYGGETSATISYTWFHPVKNHGWSISYDYRSLNSLEFTDDFYTLVLYGNNQFRDVPARLGASSLKTFNYQSLSLGWIDKKTGSNLQFGIYDNRSFSDLELSETTLQTTYNSSGDFSFAEELHLQAGSYSSSLSNGSSLFSSGIGFGFSGEYIFKIDKSQFILGFEDLGLMYFNGLEESDTSGVFEYSGFNWNIGDESPLNDVFNTLEDSLSPAVNEVDKWIMLPIFFKISYISPNFGNFYLRADGAYRIQMNFRPELGIALNYRLNESNAVWIRPAFGGFSDFSIGVGTQLNLFENTLIQVGSNHLFGILSKEGRASSLYLSLVHRL
jgi:hypothetical protein